MVVQYEDFDGTPFSIRNPISPKEISRLHQLFIDANLLVTFQQDHNFLVALSDRRDPYTSGHQKRVALISSKIAKELKLDEERTEGLYITSLIHDIGKICIPLSFLSKPGKLSEHEYGIIQGHCMEAYDILKNIEFPWPVAKIVLQHHEREDGSGYPNGLKSGQILLEVKILAVADVLEAMSTHRPYRPAFTLKKAIKEIKDNKGKLYDIKVVNACLKLFNEKKLDFLKNV